MTPSTLIPKPLVHPHSRWTCRWLSNSTFLFCRKFQKVSWLFEPRELFYSRTSTFIEMTVHITLTSCHPLFYKKIFFTKTAVTVLFTKTGCHYFVVQLSPLFLQKTIFVKKTVTFVIKTVTFVKITVTFVKITMTIDFVTVLVAHLAVTKG